MSLTDAQIQGFLVKDLQEELKKLLASLTEANELAARLRERSIEMIRMVGQDMDQLRSGQP